jgi:hypothetical protein
MLVKFGSKASLKTLRNLSITRLRGCEGVFKFTEVLGHTEAGIKVFEDIDCSEQQQLDREL